MKRITLSSMALMLAGILATAQNNTAHERTNRRAVNYGHSEFEKPELPIRKKQKSGSDWWQPDTVYIFQLNPESVVARRIYQYNQQGLLITENEQYQQDNTWIASGQCKYTYDANTNLQTKLHENWGSWPGEMYSKYSYTYDSRNNLLTELVEDRGSNNTWVNNRQEIMTYDENDNLTTHLRQSWNQNTHTWGNSTLDTYTYDSNNNLLKRFIQTPYNGTNVWRNFSQYTYTYDSDNNRLTDLYQTWADNNSGWIDGVLYTYTYYSNNNRQTELCEISTNAKEESTYTYDTENNLINQLTKTWQNGNWVNSSRINYTYDSKNNLLSYLRENWNNTWINDLQKLWTYDDNDNCTLVENFSFSDGRRHPMDIPMYLYYNNMQSSLYYTACKVTAMYKEVTKPTSIEDFSLSTISIYPNPTSGQLNITNDEQNIKQITIFDLYGVRLFDTKHATFDISHFSAGVYVVQIITEKGIVTKKIVKL